MVKAAQSECCYFNNTSDKKERSTFRWLAEPVSLRGDKEDFPLSRGFAKDFLCATEQGPRFLSSKGYRCLIPA